MLDLEQLSSEILRMGLPAFFGLPALPAIVLSPWGNPGGPSPVIVSEAESGGIQPTDAAYLVTSGSNAQGMEGNDGQDELHLNARRLSVTELPLTGMLADSAGGRGKASGRAGSSRSPTGTVTYRSNISEAFDQFGLSREDSSSRHASEDLNPAARLVLAMQVGPLSVDPNLLCFLPLGCISRLT